MRASALLRPLAIGAIALGLFPLGCSSDSAEDSSSPTTTSAEAAEVASPDLTPEGGSDAVSTLLEENAGDLCGVYAEVERVNRPFSATSDEEARTEAATLVAYLNGLSSEAMADFPDASTELATSAAAIETAIAGSDSPLETLRSLREDAASTFQDITDAVYEVAQTCGPP